MFMKKVLISALIAAGMIGAVAIPLPAAAQTEIIVVTPPPAAREEPVPAPRSGFVWSPGHWQWNPSRDVYVWAPGSWEPARAGYVYRAPAWVQRSDGWYYQTPRWDRDGDGVSNRRDAFPDNPNYR